MNPRAQTVSFNCLGSFFYTQQKKRESKMKKLFAATLILLFTQAVPAMAQNTTNDKKTGGVKSLADRITHLEKAIEREPESANWYDRIQISGVVEVEALAEKTKYKDPSKADEKSSDLDLAAVEIAVDAKITSQVDGHLLVKYEEDNIFVDEGFITLVGGESLPAYLIAGRQYIPFGSYETNFITDPATLVLGETNQGAVLAGYRFGEDLVDASIGVFNGSANETGKDDHIDSLVASISLNFSDNFILGGSYTSNLASSDSLNQVLVDPQNLDSLVGGWSAFITYAFLDRFSIGAEYLAALDSFKPGEIHTAGTRALKPKAWNLELGVGIVEKVALSVRYGGSSDGGEDFLPEKEYGTVLNWAVFENTNLAFEYMRSEFEDDHHKTDSFVTQLAIEF